MAKSKRYTDQDLILAVSESTSNAQVLTKLGLKAAGGNYKLLKRAIQELNLDTSHFTGMAWKKGKPSSNRRDIKDYLVYGSNIGSYALKLKLIKEKIFEHKCYNCGLTEWQGGKIPVELEHIDGNNINNLLSNLTLLCPNCHALTSTYRGKNKKLKV